MKMSFSRKIVYVLTLAMLIASSASAAPWKFGIISDTQWLDSPDNKNPNSVAVNVINHINQEFLNKGVKFVVAVGDIQDDGSNLALDTRATFAQALYNAGIGFYPLRGNHEQTNTAAIEFQRIFPQTQTGVNNQTPQDALVTNTIYGPQVNTNSTFMIGSNFASLSSDFAGLTYSFDYDNARFVLVDQFVPPSNIDHYTLNSADVDWVGSQLSGRPAGTHAFVFGHKHVIGENNEDTLFGPDPGDPSTFALQNSFVANLFNNGVRYYFGGHDHMHNRAIVKSPDGNSSVQDIITASDSYYFYPPANPSIDYTFDDRSGAGPVAGNSYPREIEIAQEIYTIGYHIVTVDGPKVTVEYYSSSNGCGGYNCDLTNDIIPYTFSKRETFGYSLNGREFLVSQGQPYTSVIDSYNTTTARILSGTNNSAVTTNDGRHLTKDVDTGWASATSATASDIFTLWGMTDIGADHTDTFVLSMTYNPASVTDTQIQSGSFGLKVQDAGGNWTKDAVDMNVGGSKQFVLGPWNSGYTLGAYGVDTGTHTVWAVINNSGDFAAAYASGLNLPTATISGVPSNPTLVNSATLTVGGTGVVAYKYTLDSGAPSAETPVATPISLSNLGNGQHTVSVFGKDSAGNWQTTPTTAAWVVDLTPPTTPGVPSAGGLFSTTPAVSFTWTAAADPESGISGYNLQVGTTSGGNNVFDGNIGNVLSRSVTGTNGQTLYARVQAVNGLGITGTWSAASNGITIDTVAPVTTASPAGQSYQGSQNVTLGCSDTGGSGCSNTYYCTGVGCNPSTVYSGAISIATSTDLRYFSIDAAGNSEPVTTQTYTINIVDSVAPVTFCYAIGERYRLRRSCRLSQILH
jgi:hypothetical protein